MLWPLVPGTAGIPLGAAAEVGVAVGGNVVVVLAGCGGGGNVAVATAGLASLTAGLPATFPVEDALAEGGRTLGLPTTFPVEDVLAEGGRTDGLPTNFPVDDALEEGGRTVGLPTDFPVEDAPVEDALVEGERADMKAAREVGDAAALALAVYCTGCLRSVRVKTAGRPRKTSAHSSTSGWGRSGIPFAYKSWSPTSTPARAA